MGIIKRGILGGFSGKVGNIVGSSWKGIAVIKSMPLSVANPRTAGQTSQRAKFKAGAELSKGISSSWIKPLWDRFAVRMSGYNAFMKENVRHMDADFFTMLGSLVMSQGKMLPPSSESIQIDQGSSVATVNWQSNVNDPLALDDDVVFVALASDNFDSPIVVDSSSHRSAGNVTIQMPESFVDHNVSFCIAFRRTDGTVVSTSSFHLSV